MSKKNIKKTILNNNRKKQTLNAKKVIVAGGLAFIFLIYCLIVLIKLLINPTNKFIVEQGKIYKEEAVSGYIIRNEIVVGEDISSNNIVQLKSEGNRVAKGEIIFRHSIDNEEEISNKIEDINLQIQEALKTEQNWFSTDIKLLENNIEQKLENVYENTNVQVIEQYKKEIKNSITKKANIVGDLTPSGSYIKELISQRSQLENQLNSQANYVYAPQSGVISYKVDGLEEVLTVGDFSYLNKDFFDSINVRTSQIVATSNVNAKIIDNFKGYLTCVSKTEEALSAQEGDKVKIRLPTSEEITAKLVYKNVQEGNQVLLVFEFNSSVESLINHRKISFDIIWWSDTGLKVSNSAIHYENNVAYIIRNRVGYEEKIWVKVLRQNDNYSIVENYSTAELQELGIDTDNVATKKSISMYDEIIIKNK